jgi:capsid protein
MEPRAEAYFALWSARCEVTRRFSFEECQALVCRGMDIDGEYFVHKTRDASGEPRIQLIESHRIGDRFGSKESVDGVGLDPWGAPVFYRTLEDDSTHRDLPAAAMLHIHEPEWAGGVRSHPTIQHSINHVLDEMELLALEKHAVKDNADVSRILKTARGELDDNGDFVVGGDAAAGESSDPVTLQRIVGGKLVALKPDESLESFQSNRPSPTFTGFLEHLRRDSALGMIPFEFAADSSKIGGAGVRLIVAKADRRFSFRQMILESRLIKPVWAYVIGDAIARGLLPPGGGLVEDQHRSAQARDRGRGTGSPTEPRRRGNGPKDAVGSLQRTGCRLRRGNRTPRRRRPAHPRHRGKARSPGGDAVEGLGDTRSAAAGRRKAIREVSLRDHRPELGVGR